MPKHRRCDITKTGCNQVDLGQITWSRTEESGTCLGWGNGLEEDSKGHKKEFETKYDSDEEEFFDDWPQDSRWT